MRLPKRVLLLTAFFFLAAPLLQAQKNELHVDAAADMHPVLDVIAPQFEKQTGIHLLISYGASANLSQQIQAGAPADIFFSADYQFAQRIVAAGLADSDTPTPYARGTLVLWARKGTTAYPPTLEMLRRDDLQSVSIANPTTAPYGRAAEAALKKLGLYAHVAPHLVQAENVMQAAEFGHSGNAQFALISQTIALSAAFRESGGFVLFPADSYPEMKQCAVVMKNSTQRAAAHKLLDFILSPQVQQSLGHVGLKAAE